MPVWGSYLHPMQGFGGGGLGVAGVGDFSERREGRNLSGILGGFDLCCCAF